MSKNKIKKPITTRGIGVDEMPVEIVKSKTLTGNDIGQLGGLESLPDETEVNEYRLIELSELFVSLEDSPEKLENELHAIAKTLLKENKLTEAWKTLLSFNN